MLHGNLKTHFANGVLATAWGMTRRFLGSDAGVLIGVSLAHYHSGMTEAVRVHVAEIETPIGEMIAAASDTHLLLLEFSNRRVLETQLERVKRAMTCVFERGESPVFTPLRAQLDEYFRGDRRDFDVPIHVPGTAFQSRVWAELQRIPSGTTTTYGRVARMIGQPTAVRAVAKANGDNRIAILIPCHRVIGADGQLVGYGGGLWRKRRLLQLEGRGSTLTLFEVT